MSKYITDEENRTFYYENERRVYLDGKPDTGATMAKTPPSPKSQSGHAVPVKPSGDEHVFDHGRQGIDSGQMRQYALTESARKQSSRMADELLTAFTSQIRSEMNELQIEKVSLLARQCINKLIEKVGSLGSSAGREDIPKNILLVLTFAKLYANKRPTEALTAMARTSHAETLAGKVFIELLNAGNENSELPQRRVLSTKCLQDFLSLIPKGEMDKIQAMMKANPELAVMKNDSGETALHHAAVDNRLELAGLFLSMKAQIDARDRSGYTPLHRAAAYGKVQIVRLLLDHNADVSAIIRDGKTALHLAAFWGSTEVARLLIEHHADVNARDHRGMTPLHDAADPVVSDHSEMGKFLLDHNAEIYVRDDQGRTPLSLAEERGHTNLARVLRGHVGFRCCIYCGRPLGIFHRVLGKEAHPDCLIE